jgi:hypothetical protein
MVDFFIVVGILFFVIGAVLIIKTSPNVKKINSTINEKSYQKYAKFYGEITFLDQEFENKINKIYDLIVKKHKTNIREIANETNCTYEECILKIKYLKNKRIIGDFYIDTINGIIKKCSKEDLDLLNKYKYFIYGQNRLQINEMALKFPNTTFDNIEEVEDKILEELKYLDSKNLINGLIINEVDKKIIYYSIEKHKKEKDFVSINCNSCGALNEIQRGGKTWCEYCHCIIEDKREGV